MALNSNGHKKVVKPTFLAPQQREAEACVNHEVGVQPSDGGQRDRDGEERDVSADVARNERLAAIDDESEPPIDKFQRVWTGYDATRLFDGS